MLARSSGVLSALRASQCREMRRSGDVSARAANPFPFNSTGSWHGVLMATTPIVHIWRPGELPAVLFCQE